ncbi:MAG TPA: hypothetical protein VL461_11410 [Dictyobacter sp.]|jgi:hypothetical protein|nr:hypothetical protein [Dictyobacter sp.]
MLNITAQKLLLLASLFLTLALISYLLFLTLHTDIEKALFHQIAIFFLIESGALPQAIWITRRKTMPEIRIL